MENQKSKKGMIVNCLVAYVYEHEDIFSNVLCTYGLLSTVEVLEDFSIDSSFYSVVTKDERIGYCLKDYIVLC